MIRIRIRPHAWAGHNVVTVVTMLMAATLLVRVVVAVLVSRAPVARIGPVLHSASAQPIEDVAAPVDSLPPRELVRLVLRTVARNPFRPDRSRAPTRYRLPTNGDAGKGASDRQPMPPPPPLRIVGLARRVGGGGLAALALPDGQSRLLSIGDEFAGLRLTSIAAGEVRLEGYDTVLVLRLASPIGSQRKPINSQAAPIDAESKR